ncbi:MAG: DUF934 domain-containing protein [Rhodospirillales bacterium]|jgi:uncharacterized protein (DUF934 family)
MVLIKNGQATNDPWTRVADHDALPEGPALISLARWQQEKETLKKREAPLGVVLSSADHPSLIADDLKKFELIALEFEVFRDGRNFSTARVLRDRYGFTGEIRAVGHILRDQFLFLHRAGVDAVEVQADVKKAEADWQKALAEISVFYQDTHDGRGTILRRRHGL